MKVVWIIVSGVVLVLGSTLALTKPAKPVSIGGARRRSTFGTTQS